MPKVYMLHYPEPTVAHLEVVARVDYDKLVAEIAVLKDLIEELKAQSMQQELDV